MYLTIVVVIVTPAEGPSFGGYFDISNKKIFTKKYITKKLWKQENSLERDGNTNLLYTCVSSKMKLTYGMIGFILE